MRDRERSSIARMRTNDHEEVIVAVISGEVDMMSVDAIGTGLCDHVTTHPRGLVVDLAVDFIGSAGISMLLELWGRAQREGVELAIVAATVPARRPLMVSGLDQVLPMAAAVDDAVKAIREAAQAGR